MFQIILKQIVAFFLTLPMTFAPLFGVIRHCGTAAFFEDWSANDTFTADYAVRLAKYYDAKSDATVFDAEIAGRRTMVCRRPGSYAVAR